MKGKKQKSELVWPVSDILSWKAQGVTLSEWRCYLAHDRPNLSRAVMYRTLDTYLARVEQPQSFVEVGFGSCIDFKDHFRRLHDEGQITYTGFDITEHFISHAREEHPSYDFRLGGFRDLGEIYDVAFTRHTFQHLNPVLFESSLRALLHAARVLAIITWRMTPSQEHIHWNPKAELKPEGNWVNAYDRETVLGIIRDEGFSYDIWDCKVGPDRDTIYTLMRDG